jgi:ankyrin repeat protein
MRHAVKVLATTSILAVTGLALAGQQTVDQDDGEGLEFVAAARRGDEHAVRKSLERKADLVHATDALGMTALDWATTRVSFV